MTGQQLPEPIGLASVPTARPLVDASAAAQRDSGQVAPHHGDPELQAELLASLKDMVGVAVAFMVALESANRLAPATMAFARRVLGDELRAKGIDPGACARADALLVRLEGRL